MENFIKENYKNKVVLNYWIHNLFYESINLYKRGYENINFFTGTKGYRKSFFIFKDSIIFPEVKKLTIIADLSYDSQKLKLKHILHSKDNNIYFKDFLETVKIWNFNENQKIIFLEDFPNFETVYDFTKKELIIKNFTLEIKIVNEKILKDSEKIKFFILGEFFHYNSFNNCTCLNLS